MVTIRRLAGIGVWLTPVESEMLLKVVDVDGSGEVDMDEFKDFWVNAPPFRMGDVGQEIYWTPRRCASGIYTEMLHFYDIRMSYPSEGFASSSSLSLPNPPPGSVSEEASIEASIDDGGSTAE